MSVLLDTNVVSELRPDKTNGLVRNAVAQQDRDGVFISVLSIGELRKGVGLLPTGRKRTVLDAWIHTIVKVYADRLVPIDVETCLIWGEITARARKSGIQVAATDGLIAATAIQHGLHVMTRNVKDFEPTGVLVINPWE